MQDVYIKEWFKDIVSRRCRHVCALLKDTNNRHIYVWTAYFSNESIKRIVDANIGRIHGGKVSMGIPQISS